MYNKTVQPSAVADYIGFKRKDQTTLKLVKKQNLDDDNCPVTVNNQTGLKITLGNCCTPIPRDEIVGYVTKGLGVTVHRTDCPNVINQQKRLIPVSWKDDLKKGSYPVDILIECSDRDNLVADILSILNSVKVKCSEIGARFHPENLSTTVSAQIFVESRSQLDDVFSTLKNISSINSIRRTCH